MNISIYSVLIWFTAILIGSITIVIFMGGKSSSSRSFSFCIFWVTLWILVSGLFASLETQTHANIIIRSMYFLGSIISASFLYFFLTFPEIKLNNSRIIKYLVVFEALIFYLVFFTDSIVYGIFSHPSPSRWGWHSGSLYFIYSTAFFSFFAYGIFSLYKKFRTCKEQNLKTNLKFMLLVITVGIIPPSVFSIIFPLFGFFSLNWFGPVTEIIWIPILSYSIVRYGQMNIKAVIAEVIAIGMTIIFFVNIFINNPQGPWANIGTFIGFLILTIFLIKTVLNDVENREQLSILNLTLSQKVEEQTKEIRNTYEQEKATRRDLEKLNETKDQFILITQHHIRTPTNIIVSELENIKNISYKKEPSALLQSLERASYAGQKLLNIVNDFLSISRIKLGTSILNFSNTSMLPIINSVIEELAYDLKKQCIEVHLSKDLQSWPNLLIDKSKISEAFLVIFENAIKYNKKGGFIKIDTLITDKQFQITIANSGIGISTDEQKNIHCNLFFRSEQAKILNPSGMGIGLSLAKTIIKAHKGNLQITSEGKGLGATVIVQLPIDSRKNR